MRPSNPPRGPLPDLVIVCHTGDRVDFFTAGKQATEVARLLGREVTFQFHGVSVPVRPGDDLMDLATRFHQLRAAP